MSRCRGLILFSSGAVAWLPTQGGEAARHHSHVPCTAPTTAPARHHGTGASALNDAEQ